MTDANSDGRDPLPPAIAALANETPLDRVMTRILEWIASGEPARRAAALLKTGGGCTVEQLAAVNAMPVECGQCWVARDLAFEIDETVPAQFPNAADNNKPFQIAYTPSGGLAVARGFIQ